jgi:predicted nucleotidyltransferase
MTKKRSAPVAPLVPRRYRPPDIPMAAIRRYARQIAERFQPNKIILFGSYAYGTPHDGSDVDLLVVMPAANDVTQAVRIRWALAAPFPMDLLVRTPEELRRGLEEEDWFLREVIEKGKVLYETKDSPMGAKSRVRPGSRARDRKRNATAS